jgi:hypothetical protein
MANQYYPVAQANYNGPFVGHVEQENETAQAQAPSRQAMAQAPPRQAMAQGLPPPPHAERQFQSLEEDVDDLYKAGTRKFSRRRLKKKSRRYKKSKKIRRRKSRRAKINKK